MLKILFRFFTGNILKMNIGGFGYLSKTERVLGVHTIFVVFRPTSLVSHFIKLMPSVWLLPSSMEDWGVMIPKHRKPPPILSTISHLNILGKSPENIITLHISPCQRQHSCALHSIWLSTQAFVTHLTIPTILNTEINAVPYKITTFLDINCVLTLSQSLFPKPLSTSAIWHCTLCFSAHLSHQYSIHYTVVTSSQPKTTSRQLHPTRASKITSIFFKNWCALGISN